MHHQVRRPREGPRDLPSPGPGDARGRLTAPHPPGPSRATSARQLRPGRWRPLLEIPRPSLASRGLLASPSDSPYRLRLCPQTPAPEAGLSRAPLKPQSDSAARWPASAAGRPSQIQASRAGPGQGTLFFPERCSHPPPSLELNSKGCSSLPPCTRFRRDPRPGTSLRHPFHVPRASVVGSPPRTPKTPQASAARLHPIPRTASPLHKHLLTPPPPGGLRARRLQRKEILASAFMYFAPRVSSLSRQIMARSGSKTHTHSGRICLTPPHNCTHRYAP